MKTYITLFSFLLATLSFTQTADAQRAETLFSNDIRHGGFGALQYGVTSINGQAAYLRGSRGAWVIRFRDGHAINLGFGGYRTHTNFDAINPDSFNHDNPEMRTNYGGFEIEYLNRTLNLVHFGVQSMIGSGHVRFADKDIDLEKTSDNYFVIQPGANIHLNVTHWFRLSGGVFYRHASNVNLEGTSDSDLSGPSAILALRFGKF